MSGAEGVRHYDVTREALAAALANHPLTTYLTLEARGKFADALLGQMPEASRPALGPAQREALGTLVRAIWVSWASEQPDPKPSWLTGWDELDDGQREVDMRIGEAVAEVVRGQTVVAMRQDVLTEMHDKIRAGERERIRILATSEAARMRASNFAEHEAICAAALEDFATLIREQP